MGDHDQLSREVRRHDGPARCGNPFVGLLHEPASNGVRIERRVRFPHGIDHRIPPLDVRPERAQTCLDAAGEVQTLGAANPVVADLRFCGNPCHHSPQRERHWVCYVNRSAAKSF